MDTIKLLATDSAAFAQVLSYTSDRQTRTKSFCLHSFMHTMASKDTEGNK